MKKNKFYLPILLISAITFITSCEKNKDEDPDPPVLPPTESLVMDFSDFSDPNYMGTSLKALSMDPGMAATYQNYGNAFVKVAVWNTLAGLTITIPAVTYAAALQEDPVYLGDGKWQWEFFVDSGTSETYSARLVANRISNEEFKAEMYISKTGMNSYTDFKWYEGVVRYDRTHAEWTLYESPANPVQLFSIVWNKNWETNVSDITYINIKDGAPENGSFIKFEKLSEGTFNAQYTVSTSTQEIIIEWNLESKAGHIQDSQYYQDELWHCWDELLQDIDCQ